MNSFRSFASDNHAGMHPQILEALARANEGYAKAYGEDDWTLKAGGKFKKQFGDQAEAFPVFNGTAANVLSLQALARPYQGIICAKEAHIDLDECGAPEAITGCKLLTVPTLDGKLTVDLISQRVRGIGDQHRVQPKVVSITQSTEQGAVYSLDEIREISMFAHEHGMFLHMDGARISNAAAALGVSLRAMTTDAGVDVLSFGGTKNGLALGDAVVFLRPELARDFQYIRKQNLQLASKMRFLSAQFEALFEGDLWFKNAQHANAMARLLAEHVSGLKDLVLSRPVQANAVFACLPRAAISKLQERFYFYIWNEDTLEVRWMTSFQTTEQDVLEFAEAIRQSVS